MILNIVLFIVGLALILGGATWLTDGGSALAKRWGVNELVIGLTIVAFGTSAPELTISVMAAINGSAGLAVGNVVGSNIADILLIIGATALVRPLKIGKSMLSNDIPLVILSSLAVLIAANGPLLDGTPTATISRISGLMMLLFFAIFMRYTFSLAKSAPEGSEPEQPTKDIGQLKAWLMVIGGLTALIIGGEMMVRGASAIARAMGVSEAVIGLTIVAVGTSAPELATSIVAAYKGRTGLAIGNVIGSCLFNVFMVLGLTATINPLPLDGIGNFDLLTLLGASVLLWIFGSRIKKLEITRLEGAILTACYIAYIAVLIIQA